MLIWVFSFIYNEKKYRITPAKTNCTLFSFAFRETLKLLLPDCYTGVVCDSAGHNGFGSFDNALVLWGGGDPGASCGDKKNK